MDSKPTFPRPTVSVKNDVSVEDFDLSMVLDRITLTLISRGIISKSQVVDAWMSWNDHSSEGKNIPFWRAFLDMTGVDHEAVRAEAARTYAFERAYVSTPEAAEILEDIYGWLTRDEWRRMEELAVIPVARERHPNGEGERLVFATPDPARLELHNFLHRLPFTRFAIRYAPAAVIGYLSETLLDDGALKKWVATPSFEKNEIFRADRDMAPLPGGKKQRKDRRAA